MILHVCDHCGYARDTKAVAVIIAGRITAQRWLCGECRAPVLDAIEGKKAAT